MLDPTPEQCRVLSGELNDAQTRLTLARRYASTKGLEHNARAIETLMILVQSEIDALCEAGGMMAPMWPKDDVTPTWRPEE